MMMPPAARTTIVLAGPTASGKSALALALAEALKPSGITAVLINADSMQVYRELRVLTARPGADEEARVPHRLYGVLPASERCSVARWRDLAVAAIEEVWRDGGVPIVVGGTGLYIRALLDGLAPVPEIPEEIRKATADHFEAIGAEAFHAALAARDPVSAARLAGGDRQRLLRAWEVVEATGRSLSRWHREAAMPGLAGGHMKILLECAREDLYRRCEMRFDAMLEAGALDEVARLHEAGLDPDLPAMKALGVAVLGALSRGEIDRETAAEQVRKETRNFAKRQMTWFRNQYEPDLTVSGNGALATCIDAVERFLLTVRGSGST
jgi:tRNA dimethylallyltransferase